jgi:hypothetical protein
VQFIEILPALISKVCWFRMILCRVVSDCFLLDKQEEYLIGLYGMMCH